MKIPGPLIEDIALGRCHPFIGAGFSLNAILPPELSMPDWAGLTDQLKATAAAPEDLDGPATASYFERRFGRVQLIEAVRRSLHSDDVQPGSAHTSFARLPFDTVYTTNFDLLLEDAYALIRKPFRSLVGELQIPFHGGPLSTNVVKMHGDLRHEEHIVITASDYSEYLDIYPVIATHLSAMLITRTPLFIGYSLTDPDFDHIRTVIRSRLGQFERMSYLVQFNQSPRYVEGLLDDRLHVINLKVRKKDSVDELLSSLFQELLEELDVKTGEGLRAARPDLFEQVPTDRLEATFEAPDASQLLSSTSSLCFVLMPFGGSYEQTFEYLIRPAVEQFGLRVLRADNISAPGSVLEQIRSAIRQSRVCLADLTGGNPNVLYELGIAQTLGKPTILLAQDLRDLPFDIAHHRVIQYENDPEGMKVATVQLAEAIRSVLGAGQLEEAQRLSSLGMYRAAAASLGIVLEHRLRELSSRAGIESKTRRWGSMGQQLTFLQKSSVLSADDVAVLRQAIVLRNRAVHEMSELDSDQVDLMFSAVARLDEGTQSA